MSQKIINIGQAANDKSGDPLRLAFDKVNQNFTELFNTDVSTRYHLGDDTQFIDIDPESGTVVVQSGYDTSMPVYIKGGNCSDGGIGGDVYIEAGGAPLPNTGTTGVVGISGQEVTIETDGAVTSFVMGGGGNPYVTFPEYEGGQLSIQSSEVFSLGTDIPLVLSSTKSEVWIRTNTENQYLAWTFDKNGTINTPLKVPTSFTAIADEAHYSGEGSITLDPEVGDPWYFGVTFAVDPNGAVETQIDNPARPNNPGYADDMEFSFTEADHGIAGYTFSITLLGIQTPGDFMVTTNLVVTTAPAYPSTVKSEGALKFTANGNDWVLGTTGHTTLPGLLQVSNGLEGSITGPNGVNIYARNATPLGLVWSLDDQENLYENNPLLNTSIASVQLGLSGLSIEINTATGGGYWTFSPNKTLRMPPGGDIVDSNGTSVLGGGGGSGSSLTNNGHTISLNAAGNFVLENSGSVFGAPAQGGAKDKITFYDLSDQDNMNYAVGVDSQVLWHSVDTGSSFKWYTDTTVVAELNALHLQLAGQLLVKATDNFNAIQFSDNGTNDSANIKVDGGQNMAIRAASNIYIARAGQNRIAITDHNSDFMANDAVTIQSNKAVSGQTKTWTFGTDGSFAPATGSNLILNGGAGSGIGGTSGAVNISTQTLPVGGGSRSGNIELTTGSADVAGKIKLITAGKTWQFENNGILTLPSNNYLETTDTNLKVGSQGTVTIRSNAETSEGTQSWAFGTDGNLTLPTGGNIVANLESAELVYNNYLAAEFLFEATRNEDASAIYPNTRPWANMPAQEAYPLIIEYVEPPHVLPWPSFGTAQAAAANTAYNDWQLALAANSVIISANSKNYEFGGDGNLTVPNGGNIFASALVQNASSYDTRVSLNSAAGLVEITTNGNSTQFKPSGEISLNGASTISGGTFGGSVLVVGLNQTDLKQLRGGNVTVQVGPSGTTTSTWTFGADSKLTTPGEVVISTDNIHGGTGYTGFLTLTSTQAGVTNPNKFIRLNSTGNLQIVNSTYTGTIFDLADNGNVTLSGTLTFPAGGTFNVKGSVPSGSQGAEGDKAGTVAFDSSHMYYCKADYTNGLSDIWVRVVWTETNW